MYSMLFGDSESKKTLGRPRRRWEVNFEMPLEVTVYDDVS
jgi:hypothetical protein